MKIRDYRKQLIDSYKENRKTFIFYTILRIMVLITLIRCIITGNYQNAMLHTMNGFLCAAIGFSLIYLLNRGSENFNLSPFYLTLVAFCFSMTVGVVWEFFEFTMDQLFFLDMQKDFIVQEFGSVTLDPANMGTPIDVAGITETIIHTASGETYTVSGGYLDIGILDTMKDLLVNLVGAVVFSFIGYSTLKYSKSSKIADNLIIKPKGEE